MVVPAANGLTMRLWASEPMLRNPVALTVDPRGRVLVTETTRRKAADLDIRQFREWVETDLSLDTVEAKRAFYRRELTAERGGRYARLGDQNGDGVTDWRDLTVLSDLIHRLEDTGGSGAADRVTVFADGFDTEVTGVAAGVYAWENTVYATVEPDVWRLEDRDGDGRAEVRERLATGFSVHVAYAGHNMSGPIVGPDGRLYFAVADKGFSVTTREGARLHHPNQGAVLRCELDGRGLEVFARGLRNTQQIAFDAHGNLFSVDNDGDLPGERERFVCIVEGSDAGWRSNWQYRGGAYNPWLAEELFKPAFDGQAAYLLPPLANYSDGPAGFVANPGTALNERYHDAFFLSWFPGRRITAFRIEPEGAGFRMVDEHLVTSGMLTTGLAIGPEGGLWAADWASGGYELDEKGRVWVLDDPAEAGSERRRETLSRLTADLATLADESLVEWLGDADQRVRLRAQCELARRPAGGGSLIAVAGAPGHPRLARLHGIWGAGQAVRLAGGRSPDVIEALREGVVRWLSDDDDEVRGQAAKVAGDVLGGAEIGALEAALVGALADPEPRVRFLAGIACGRLGLASAFEPLVALAAENDGADRFLRHAAVMGMAGCGAGEERLAGLRDHAAPEVRRCAVVALRRLGDPSVAGFLADPDPSVVDEAARAIHDDFSIAGALPALAGLLDGAEATLSEATFRRVLSAGQRIRSVGAAKRVARMAAHSTAEVERRVLALETLGSWASPGRLDAVEGRFRPLEPVDVATLREAVGATVAGLVDDPHEEIRKAAIGTIQSLGLVLDPDALVARVRDAGQPAGTRTAALGLIAATAPGRLREVVDVALSGPPDAASLRSAAWGHLADLDPDAYAERLREAWDTAGTRERQAAVAALAAVDAGSAAALRWEMWNRLVAGEIAPPIALDVLEMAIGAPDEDLAEAAREWDERRAQSGPAGRFAGTLEGGDDLRGEAIVRHHVAAQCLRCHAIGGGGSLVGPDLAGVAGRLTPEERLEALVDPHATVAEGFGIGTITLENGETLTGTVREGGNGVVTVIAVGGSESDARQVPSENIATRTPPVSPMPPMGAILSRRELRDVLAFLATLQ